MVNGLAEQHMLLTLTERAIESGDELIERHSDVQRACAEHAVELQKLLELHEKIGAMLATERQRFAAYFPRQAEPPARRIAAAGQNARTPADAPQNRP